MKRLFTILMLMLTIIPFSAWGSYDFIVDGIYYEINPDLETISVYGDYDHQYSGDVVIPESVSYNGEDYRVVAIRPEAFKYNYDLKSISLPNSIQVIGEFAFAYCNITSLTIPSSVKTIELGAFTYCDFTSLFIPKSVEEIGAYAFSECDKLTNLTIEEGSKVVIGLSAFQLTEKLSSISFPNSITELGADAFRASEWYNNQPNGSIYIGKIFYGYKGNDKSRVLNIEEGTIAIASEALRNYNLRYVEVNLPSTLKVIGDRAFYNTGLSVINLPPNLVKIGDSAFEYCNLSSIIFPESLKYIGPSAFRYCDLSNITFPDSLEYIGSLAFADNTKLESIALPPLITIIQSSIFYNCTSLSSVSYSDDVTYIGPSAFENCYSLATIPVPSKLEYVHKYSFWDTKWFDNQPNGVVYFGDIAIDYKGRMPSSYNLIIKEGTTAIASGAFRYENIVSVSIPNSVKRIGSYAFASATGLKSIVLPSSLTSINAGTFYKCTSLESIVIPEGVTKIDYNAFFLCENLSSVTLPSTLTEIMDYAFSYCTSLTSINLPEPLTMINGNTFERCSSLKEIIIPDNVRYIECNAFNQCKSLTDLTLGKSVKKIGAFAFCCPWIYRVVSLNPEPPMCQEEAFSTLHFEDSRLNVPKKSIDLYSQAPIWKNFPLIVELGVGAVDNLQEDKFSITGRQGEIHINGANGEQIEIYSTSGILQYRAISDGNDVISLPAGIYIVKVDGKTYKLAI